MALDVEEVGWGSGEWALAARRVTDVSRGVPEVKPLRSGLFAPKWSSPGVSPVHVGWKKKKQKTCSLQAHPALPREYRGVLSAATGMPTLPIPRGSPHESWGGIYRVV